MRTLTRRSLLTIAGIGGLASITASARVHIPAGVRYSCGAAMGTPAAHIDSDIPFEQAYIDTTIPYHLSTLKLLEIASADLEDERLIAVRQELVDALPGELEELAVLREDIFGEATPEEPTHEMMLLSMGGVESCTDQAHMDFMNSEWVEKTYKGRDEKEFTFVNMMVLLLEMAQHQHHVGVQLATNEDVKEFCERVEKLREPQIKVFREVRAEMMAAY